MALKKGSKQPAKLPRALYERELLRLQTELVKLQEWVRAEAARLVIVFEGRDAAGKGSTIKRVSEFLNPRVARIAARGAFSRNAGKQKRLRAFLTAWTARRRTRRTRAKAPSKPARRSNRRAIWQR